VSGAIAYCSLPIAYCKLPIAHCPLPIEFSMNNRVVFINENFIEEDKAMLHISDLALLRGYGIFDFFRTVNHRPLFLEDHLDRFFNSAFTMRLQFETTREELKSIIQQLIKKNNIPASGIRILLTGGYSTDNYQCTAPNLVITQHPLNPHSAESFSKGLKVITHEYRRELPDVKTTNYIMGIWMQEKIKEYQAEDVLYHFQGEVSEFPRSNFFIVTNEDVIVTPAENILKGITRMKTIELAKKVFEVEQRVITMDDVRYAKEAFLTSTTKRILPVVQVDDMIIGSSGPGNVTKILDVGLSKMIGEL
jgi:branched-chain amino acid aminotransferase